MAQLAPDQVLALTELFRDHRWTNDLLMISEWSKTYKRDRETADAFANIAAFNLLLIRNRGSLERLAADTTTVSRFMISLFELAKYGETYDDQVLRNSVNGLAAAVMTAAPDLRDSILYQSSLQNTVRFKG